MHTGLKKDSWTRWIRERMLDEKGRDALVWRMGLRVSVLWQRPRESPEPRRQEADLDLIPAAPESSRINAQDCFYRHLRPHPRAFAK